MSPLRVAVAIPTYRREEVLIETIQQVLAQQPAADEVLVIDQTPEHDPATEQYLQEQNDAGRLRWIRHSPPNLPLARNRALCETDCEIVIFIDDDVILTPDFIAHHVANYIDDRIHGVAGRTLQPSQGPRKPRRRPWPRMMDFLYFPLDGTERIEDVAVFIGANHSVRRRTMLELGGYDANFVGPANREDGDAATRLWQNGKIVVFDPEACVRHLASPAGGCQTRILTTRRPGWMKMFGENYFLWRHVFPSPRFFYHLLFRAPRELILNRQNLKHPWRIPLEVFNYFQAMVRGGLMAWRKNSQPIASPCSTWASAISATSHPITAAQSSMTANNSPPSVQL